MDSSLAFVENAPWHVKSQPSWGWNERSKEKAKKLMQEAGYKGEPIRFVTTQEYKWMYDFALVTKQQLEDVGFNVDLQVVDWATLVKRRNNPKEYEAFTTGTGNIFEPTAYTVLSCTWPGWTCDADIQGLMQEMAKETDPKKRFALWEQMHKLWYEKVPSIRYGDLHGLRAASKKLHGFNEKTERPRFYNIWLDR
jgi:peptide/nickel transport system substrate-binding protein